MNRKLFWKYGLMSDVVCKAAWWLESSARLHGDPVSQKLLRASRALLLQRGTCVCTATERRGYNAARCSRTVAERRGYNAACASARWQSAVATTWHVRLHGGGAPWLQRGMCVCTATERRGYNVARASARRRSAVATTWHVHPHGGGAPWLQRGTCVCTATERRGYN